MVVKRVFNPCQPHKIVWLVKPYILGIAGLNNKAVAIALASVAQKLRTMAYISSYDCQTGSEAINIGKI